MFNQEEESMCISNPRSDQIQQMDQSNHYSDTGTTRFFFGKTIETNTEKSIFEALKIEQKPLLGYRYNQIHLSKFSCDHNFGKILR